MDFREMPKISRSIHFPGNFGHFPGNQFPWKSISRVILGISREIPLEMAAGKPPGKFGWPARKFPGKSPRNSWVERRISRGISREMAKNSPGNMDHPSRIWSVRPILQRIRWRNPLIHSGGSLFTMVGRAKKTPTATFPRCGFLPTHIILIMEIVRSSFNYCKRP